MDRVARFITLAEFLPTIPEAARGPFSAWIKEHRDIWELFEDYAKRAAAAGQKFGAKAIVERIRWECVVERRGEFKIQNSMTAYMARFFTAKWPEYSDLFAFREVRGIKEAA